jgi:rubrerythrin
MKFTIPFIAILISLAFLTEAQAKVPTATVGNLKAAFTGETTASAKYAAFAQQARKDGHVNIALLFEAASKAESIHANNHKAALEQLGEKAPEVKPDIKVNTTRQNLEEAIKGESYEVATMYPDFLKAANAENVNIALLSFNYAYKTEQRHKALYENALKALDENKVATLPSQYQVCTTCGNTYDNAGPSRCGLCMTSNERFVTFK